VLQELDQILQPRLYLAIGVQTGKSLMLAKDSAIGIDPMQTVTFDFPKTAEVIAETSNHFFSVHANRLLLPGPNMMFIDGTNLFEYAMRDFTNIERYAHDATLVIVDDILPNSQAQAQRSRITKA
jgi:hypothetical protein